MANLSCFVCGNVFLEWDSVACDGCTRTTHRETCGEYELITREGETIAYYFCDLCMNDVPDDDEWEAQ